MEQIIEMEKKSDLETFQSIAEFIEMICDKIEDEHYIRAAYSLGMLQRKIFNIIEEIQYKEFQENQKTSEKSDGQENKG